MNPAAIPEYFGADPCATFGDFPVKREASLRTARNPAMPKNVKAAGGQQYLGLALSRDDGPVVLAEASSVI